MIKAGTADTVYRSGEVWDELPRCILCIQNTEKYRKYLLTFYKHRIIINLQKRTEAPVPQRHQARYRSITREWGKVLPKPRMTNTVCVEEYVRWRKPVIGLLPEKAGQHSAGGASRETCWIVRMLLQNGYGDVLSVWNIFIAVFYFQLNRIFP